jgi:hypothetical protein
MVHYSVEEKMTTFEERRQQAFDEREAHKKKLAEKYGVVGHPKLDRCYDLAWEHGHSSGWTEVQIYFADFVELIK